MKKTLTLILILISSSIAFCQVDPIDKKGLAIGGYDVVAYFKSAKAVKGYSDFSEKYNNATYYFTNEENRQDFLKNPEKYLPQYDGYCALAIGTTKKKISIDPETFRVTDGKLYLFFHGKSFSGTKFNSLDPWVKDEKDLIKKSDTNWPSVKQKKYSPM
jgi:YHS domain-containing protein